MFIFILDGLNFYFRLIEFNFLVSRIWVFKFWGVWDVFVFVFKFFKCLRIIDLKVLRWIFVRGWLVFKLFFLLLFSCSLFKMSFRFVLKGNYE